MPEFIDPAITKRAEMIDVEALLLEDARAESED